MAKNIEHLKIYLLGILFFWEVYLFRSFIQLWIVLLILFLLTFFDLPPQNVHAYVCVCMCVCVSACLSVCVRGGEGQGEGERESDCHLGYGGHMCCYWFLLFVCVCEYFYYLFVLINVIGDF
jgi:hypothetical protein